MFSSEDLEPDDDEDVKRALFSATQTTQMHRHRLSWIIGWRAQPMKRIQVSARRDGCSIGHEASEQSSFSFAENKSIWMLSTEMQLSRRQKHLPQYLTSFSRRQCADSIGTFQLMPSLNSISINSSNNNGAGEYNGTVLLSPSRCRCSRYSLRLSMADGVIFPV